MQDNFIEQSEEMLSTIVRLFAREGSAREVAILAESKTSLEQTDYDNWNGGTYIYTLFVDVPLGLFTQIQSSLKEIQEKLLDKMGLVVSEDRCYIREVTLRPQLIHDKDWRVKAKAWLRGSNVNNQGRVRSDNIASRNCDGLLFRSQPEIYFYKALKSLGFSFAPLPVFVKGGDMYQRIEPDFVIVRDGIMLVVEIDGDTVHQESPAEAHARTTMLHNEGVYIERITASDCDTLDKALLAAKRVAHRIERVKEAR